MPVTQERKLDRRRNSSTIQNVVERLDQMQDLLIEMRGALDFQLRVMKRMQLEIEVLNESRRRRSTRKFYEGRAAAADVAHEPATPRD